jgi:hypothetical protein
MDPKRVIMTKRIACLFVIGLLFGADQPSDAAKKDLEKFQGEWKPEKAQRNGEDAPPEHCADEEERLHADRRRHRSGHCLGHLS